MLHFDRKSLVFVTKLIFIENRSSTIDERLPIEPDAETFDYFAIRPEAAIAICFPNGCDITSGIAVSFWVMINGSIGSVAEPTSNHLHLLTLGAHDINFSISLNLRGDIRCRLFAGASEPTAEKQWNTLLLLDRWNHLVIYVKTDEVVINQQHLGATVFGEVR